METSISTQKVDKPWQFKPGQSGNPLGRPRDIVRYVRETTHDGRDLVDKLLAIANDADTTKRDRIRALEVLLDRGFGRAPLTIDAVTTTVSATLDLTAAPTDVLREFIQSYSRMLGYQEPKIE